jgi:hypothetical protein
VRDNRRVRKQRFSRQKRIVVADRQQRFVQICA